LKQWWIEPRHKAEYIHRRLGKNQIKEKEHRKQASTCRIGYFLSLHNLKATSDSKALKKY
jgi:hypothetical protein